MTELWVYTILFVLTLMAAWGHGYRCGRLQGRDEIYRRFGVHRQSGRRWW